MLSPRMLEQLKGDKKKSKVASSCRVRVREMPHVTLAAAQCDRMVSAKTHPKSTQNVANLLDIRYPSLLVTPFCPIGPLDWPN